MQKRNPEKPLPPSESAPGLVHSLAGYGRIIPIICGVAIAIHLVANAAGLARWTSSLVVLSTIGVILLICLVISFVVLFAQGWRVGFQPLLNTSLVGFVCLALVGAKYLGPHLSLSQWLPQPEGFDWGYLELKPTVVNASLARELPASTPGATFTPLDVDWRELEQGGLHWSSDGRLIYLLYPSGELLEVDARDLNIRRKLELGEVRRMTACSRGLLVLMASRTEILLIDRESFAAVEWFELPPTGAICGSAESDYVCLERNDEAVLGLYDVERRIVVDVTPLQVDSADLRGIHDMRMTADGRHLLVQSGQTYAFRIDNGRFVFLTELTGPLLRKNASLLSATNMWYRSSSTGSISRYLISGSASSVLKVHDGDTGESYDVVIPRGFSGGSTDALVQPFETGFVAWHSDHASFVELDPDGLRPSRWWEYESP